MLEIDGLSSVVLCQQLSTAGSVSLICHLFKTAGCSMRKGTFAPTASLQMGVFVKIDPDLCLRAPQLLVRGCFVDESFSEGASSSEIVKKLKILYSPGSCGGSWDCSCLSLLNAPLSPCSLQLGRSVCRSGYVCRAGWPLGWLLLRC